MTRYRADEGEGKESMRMTIQGERAQSRAEPEAFAWNGADPDLYVPAENDPRVGWWRRLFVRRAS